MHRQPDQFVIIGKEGCVWCDKTKALFHKHHLEFTYVEAKGEMRDFLVSNGLFTVPQVYVNGERIGTHDDTVLWLENNYARQSE